MRAKNRYNNMTPTITALLSMLTWVSLLEKIDEASKTTAICREKILKQTHLPSIYSTGNYHGDRKREKVTYSTEEMEESMLQ